VLGFLSFVFLLRAFSRKHPLAYASGSPKKKAEATARAMVPASQTNSINRKSD
jgi:hypothetical protein